MKNFKFIILPASGCICKQTTRRKFLEASSEAFTEICQKLKLNRKRNVASTLF